MKKKMKNKKIPPKNYILAIGICLFTIFFVYYFFLCYNAYNKKKYNTSYLLNSKTIDVSIKDLENIDSEVKDQEEYYLYLSYTGNEEIYKLEKELKKIINEYKLNDIFYYVDIKKIKEEENFLEKLNQMFHFEETKIDTLPTIIYYKNKKVSIINREDKNIMTSSDFLKLLEMNEIKK